MLRWTEAQQVSLACLEHQTFKHPQTGLILLKSSAEDSSRSAAEGKDICTPGTWGSRVRLVTDFKAGWGDTSPCTPEAVLDGLGFP